MMTVNRVFLLPGLGGYGPGVLGRLAEHPAFSSALAPVDQAAREYGLPAFAELLADPAGPCIEDLARSSVQLHVSAFAAGVAVHAVLRAEGIHPDAVMGFSTGELAALAVSGCLSSYDAARLLCERELALSELRQPGGIVALEVDAGRAVHLCAVTGDQSLSPSLFNGLRQTGVSGQDAGLAALEKVARAVGVLATRLLAGFPYHNPMLAASAKRLAEVTSDYAVSAPSMPMYTPMLCRYVATRGDVRELIAGHLTRPVYFAKALQQLYASGMDWFIEVGARSILTELARGSLPTGVKLTAPLRTPVDLDTLLAAVGESPSTPGTPAHAVRPGPAPAHPLTEQQKSDAV